MRVKSFSAPTLAEAMEQVRETLGPEAIIISTYEAKRGRGAEILAAVDVMPKTEERQNPEEHQARERFPVDAPVEPRLSAKSQMPPPHQLQDFITRNLRKHPLHTGELARADEEKLSLREPNLRNSNTATLKRALTFHGCSRTLGNALLSACDALGLENLTETLTKTIELRFAFSPIRAQPGRPILLVGPPGVGKTVVTAKLAARSLLQGATPELITTDTISAGAREQLSGLGLAMGKTVLSVESPAELNEAILSLKNDSSQAPAIFIDTPATNHYVSTEIDDLRRFLDNGDVEPVLVLAADGNGAELSESALAFAKLGVERVIVTRLDATRRIGGVLSAVDVAGLALAQFSRSPYVGRGLDPFISSIVATELLNAPKPKKQKPDVDQETTQARRAIQ